MAKKPERWKMPAWMTHFAHHFVNTGCQPTVEEIERLVNGHTDPQINLPLSTIEFGVKSQVALLNRLYGVGKLTP
jgi:hypothetical protein